MALTPKNGDLTAGVAGQRSEVINPSPDAWVTGDAPQQSTDAYGVAADQEIAAREAVGLDGDGNLIPAVMGTTQAIGFAVYAVDTTGLAAGEVKIGVYIQGVFNPELAVYDASYATAEDKRTAFRGAPSPTTIIMRHPQAMNLLNPDGTEGSPL